MNKLKQYIDNCITNGVVPAHEIFYTYDISFDTDITDDYMNKLIDNNEIIYIDFILKHQEVSDVIKQRILDLDNKILNMTLNTYSKSVRLANYVYYLIDKHKSSGYSDTLKGTIRKYIESHRINYNGDIINDVNSVMSGLSVDIIEPIFEEIESRLHEIPIGELNKDFIIDPSYIDNLDILKQTFPNKNLFKMCFLDFTFSENVINHIIDNINDYVSGTKATIEFINKYKVLYTTIDKLSNSSNLYLVLNNINDVNFNIVKSFLDVNTFLYDVHKSSFEDSFKKSLHTPNFMKYLREYVIPFDILEKYVSNYSLYFSTHSFNTLKEENKKNINILQKKYSDKYESDMLKNMKVNDNILYDGE